MTTYQELFIALAVLQGADMATTLTILNQGGAELNPWMASLFKRFGAAFVLGVTKLTALAAVWYFIPEGSEYAIIALSLAVLGYTGVVIHNLFQVRFK
jgi:hypothetical protein